MRGWKELIGREPEAGDLLIPSREGRNRNANLGMKRFSQDLERLKLRRRRQHDLRRTFISLAQLDGALPHILKLVTHGASGDIISQYTTLPWPSLCAEVAKLKLELPSRRLRAVPNVVNLRGVHEPSVTIGVTVDSVHSPEIEKGPKPHELGAFYTQRGGRDLNLAKP